MNQESLKSWFLKTLEQLFPACSLHLHPKDELHSVVGYHNRLHRDGHLRDIHQIIEVGPAVEHEMTIEYLRESYEKHREVCRQCHDSMSDGHCSVGKFYFHKIHDVRRKPKWGIP